MRPASVRTARLPLVLAFTALAAGCGGSGDGDPAAPPGNGGGGGGSFVSTTSVSVVDSYFEPENIAVEGGAEVTWTWNGQLAHNVTWADGSLANSSTQTGGTFTLSMPTTAGDYVYYCTQHGSANAGMRGVVRVQ